FQAEDGIRDYKVTGVQTCALPICFTVCSKKLPPGRTALPRADSKAASEPSGSVEQSGNGGRAGRPDGRGDPQLQTVFSSQANLRSEERRVGKECRSRWGT